MSKYHNAEISSLTSQLSNLIFRIENLQKDIGTFEELEEPVNLYEVETSLRKALRDLKKINF